MTSAENDREAWLAERRKGVGASEIGMLFGCSTYGALLSMWADKTGRPTAKRSPQAELAMRIGNRLEGFVIELAEEELGCQIVRNSRSKCMPGHPLVRATTDGYVKPAGDDEACCMDAKVVGAHNAHEWTSGSFPLTYQLQLQTQMMVEECRSAVIAGMIQGSATHPLVIRRIEYDPELADIIVARVEWFWATYIATDTPPPADSHPTTGPTIGAMHPQDNGMMIKLGRPLQFARDDWQEAVAEAAALKKRIALRENQLCLGLEDATFGEFPDGSGISLRTQRHGSGSTFRKLRTMAPGLVARERKTSDALLDKILKGN